jgi:NAD(P)-dependent dehydrogenase (short-subunit alcohol dehydrogenase family)
MSTKNWTLADISDLTGKTVIVTGGNSGLGFEAVKELSGKNARVIMACRSTEKGEAARAQIIEKQPEADIAVMQLDLADLKSIRSFVTLYQKKYARLDILLNNAGIMMGPYRQTKDGFESQIGTNHLGHFALTGLLLDTLKVTPKSRVVSVSSMAHKTGTMDTANFMYNNGDGYTPLKAYSRSKLCNLLFTYELQRYFDANKIDCMAVAAHPGVSDTNLFNDAAPKWLLKVFRPLFLLAIQPAHMGVLPELRAAVDPTVRGGDYYGPDGKREMKGYPVLVQSTKEANCTTNASDLWRISEKLTSVKFE